MPDNAENHDDIDTPSERESLPLRPEEAGEDGGESPERDLAPFPFMGGEFPERDLPPLDRPPGPMAPIPERNLDTIIDKLGAADERAKLEGSTDDGLSPVYVEGRFRFVTPCHVSKHGLRASQICATCFGDLKYPVSTAVALACGHWSTAEFSQGERRQTCGVCGEHSVIKAERVAVTRYDVRPLSVSEQQTFPVET